MKTPPASSASISKSMKSNRSSGTGPEKLLSRLLRKKILINDLPGRPDFVYQRQKVAIFVHGCFWHRCKICSKRLPRKHRIFWQKKFENNVKRDVKNKARLHSMGWIVLEIWEHEVKTDSTIIVKRIKNLIRRREMSARSERLLEGE